jgi:hypothetical protein
VAESLRVLYKIYGFALPWGDPLAKTREAVFPARSAVAHGRCLGLGAGTFSYQHIRVLNVSLRKLHGIP